MQDTQYYLQAAWEWTQFVFWAIVEHLPMVLLYLGIGLAIGVGLAILLFQIFKRKGILLRAPAAHRAYRMWVKAAGALAIVAVLVGSLSLATALAAQRAVRIELRESLSAGTQVLVDNYLVEDDGRDNLEAAFDFVMQSGTYVDQTNHALADALAEQYILHQGDSKLLAFFSRYLLSGRIEDGLVSMEKKVIYTLLEVGMEYVHMRGLIQEDSFEEGFDQWLEEDLHEVYPDIADLLLDIIWTYLGPAVFGIFLPFILGSLAFIAIPFIDWGIYGYREKRRVVVS